MSARRPVLFPDHPLSEAEMRYYAARRRRPGVCPACGRSLEKGEDVSPSGERSSFEFCEWCGWMEDGDDG